MANKLLHFKLVLLGESSVGKSSLVLRFVKGEFQEFQESTIGAAFIAQQVVLDDCTVKFEIWDTAGQERYHSLAPMYYRGAQAAVVVFDISCRESFEKAKSWISELHEKAHSVQVIALAGNKSDLRDAREVPTSEAGSFAAEHGLLFLETSARTSENVNEIFIEIARRLPKEPQQRGNAGGGKRLLGPIGDAAQQHQQSSSAQSKPFNCCN